MKPAAAVLLLAAASCAAPDVADLRLQTGRTRVIAHRGGTGPDGTVAGCRRTLAMGVVFLELDVRLTKDGQAVILHDPSVDRTTDGRGPVDQMTFEELRRLDAGVKFRDPAEPDRSYAGERVPTVAELLHAVGDRGVVLLELKVLKAAGPVMEAIRAEGAFQRAVVRTDDMEVLAAIRNSEPRILTGTFGPLPAEAELAALVAQLRGLGVSTITPRQVPSRDAVRRFQAAGIAVWATNTNDEVVMRQWIDVGADGIITDRPELLASILRTGSPPRRS
jgi:glycerophosphoryl diester phosphodiesterase